jgi:hypothetical protein
MSYRTKAIAAALLSLASLVPMSFASAADLPVKVKAKPIPDLPFFLVIDDRVTYSYIGRGTDPGAFSVKPNGTLNGNTAKSVYSSRTSTCGPTAPTSSTSTCSSRTTTIRPAPASTPAFTPGGILASCSGATEFFGLIRSTFGWNEIFNTKAFTMGPLHNISFEIGAEGETENNYFAPNKRAFEAGLQFAFDLPYKGYFNVAPLAYKELNRSSFTQCGNFTAAGVTPGVNCNLDSEISFKTTWAVEINYYMDLGFLPESVNYFAISGRAGWYGPGEAHANFKTKFHGNLLSCARHWASIK